MSSPASNATVSSAADAATDPAATDPAAAATDPVAAPERSYRALLDVEGLGRVILGMQLARISQSMMVVVLVLFSLDAYHSPGIAGAVALAAGLPGALASPVAGALLDRHRRIRLVALDYFVAAAALGLIVMLAFAGALPAFLLIAIAAAASLTGPLSLAGLRGLLPLMTPRHLWERANALDSMGYMIATLIGPPIGAVLVQLFGGQVALVAVAFGFLGAVLVIGPVGEPALEPQAGGSLLRSARDGLTYTLRNPTLRALACSISFANITWGMTAVAIPLIVLDRLGQSASVVGIVFSVQALGGIVGAFVAGRWHTRGKERLMLIGPMIGTGLVLLLLIPDGGIALVVVSMVLIGLLNGPLDIAMFTVRQRRTAPEWMGRAFAVSMGLNGLGIPLGSGITGWLSEYSVDAAIIVAAACSFAAAVATFILMPREE